MNPTFRFSLLVWVFSIILGSIATFIYLDIDNWTWATIRSSEIITNGIFVIIIIMGFSLILSTPIFVALWGISYLINRLYEPILTKKTYIAGCFGGLIAILLILLYKNNKSDWDFLGATIIIYGCLGIIGIFIVKLKIKNNETTNN